MFTEPLQLFGDGNYALSNVKEIKVSESFLNLESKVKKCQTQELLEECTSRQFMEKMIEGCNCTPFGLIRENSAISMVTEK